MEMFANFYMERQGEHYGFLPANVLHQLNENKGNQFELTLELLRDSVQFDSVAFDESTVSYSYDAVNDVTRGTDTILSTEASKVKVAVIATNEELVIAQDTFRLINK